VRSGDPLPLALIATLAQTLLEPPPLDGCQPLHHLLHLPFDGALDGLAPEATGKDRIVLEGDGHVLVEPVGEEPVLLACRGCPSQS